MILGERKQYSFLLLAILGFGASSRVNAFAQSPPAAAAQSIRPLGNRLATKPASYIVPSLSNDNNNNDNNNENDDKTTIDLVNIFDLDLLTRRWNQADKVEIRNDATLVACYVLSRFLVYDITSGAKVQPGWEVQDWIWLTGTFSSAVVLMVYYVIAGLLSRAYESNTAFAVAGPSPVIRALVNVVLCTPIWLATEHLLGFGPSDIGGNTLAITVTTGFVGFGSFMALAKILTAGMR